MPLLNPCPPRCPFFRGILTREGAPELWPPSASERPSCPLRVPGATSTQCGESVSSRGRNREALNSKYHYRLLIRSFVYPGKA